MSRSLRLLLLTLPCMLMACGGGGHVASTDDAGAGGDAGNPAAGGDGGVNLELPACPVVTACDAPPPDPGPRRGWRHTSSTLIAVGSDHHRGRDSFYTPGEPQWIIGKIAYGLDVDLEDEEVDAYLLRDCGTAWEKLGTVRTSTGSGHATVEGVPDAGGRVYYRIPADKQLGPGRHRVHLVVAGDLTTADLFIEVVAPAQPMFVSDVDGTLTGTETEEFTALLSGSLPSSHPDAPAVLRQLAARGYRPMYLTARPEYLVGRTREFLRANDYPPGIIHTTTGITGAVGGGAATFKEGELAAIKAKGLSPSWGFGNTASDADAYAQTTIVPRQRVFYQFTDTHGGRRIEAYSELLSETAGLAPLCR